MNLKFILAVVNLAYLVCVVHADGHESHNVTLHDCLQGALQCSDEPCDLACQCELAGQALECFDTCELDENSQQLYLVAKLNYNSYCNAYVLEQHASNDTVPDGSDDPVVDELPEDPEPTEEPTDPVVEDPVEDGSDDPIPVEEPVEEPDNPFADEPLFESPDAPDFNSTDNSTNSDNSTDTDPDNSTDSNYNFMQETPHGNIFRASGVKTQSSLLLSFVVVIFSLVM